MVKSKELWSQAIEVQAFTSFANYRLNDLKTFI